MKLDSKEDWHVALCGPLTNIGFEILSEVDLETKLDVRDGPLSQLKPPKEPPLLIYVGPRTLQKK